MRGRADGGGGRALRWLVAAAGLVAALSAAGCVFLLGQWRELSAAVRQLQEDAARRTPPSPAALRHHHHHEQGGQGPTEPAPHLLPTAAGGRNKRSQRGRGCAKLRLLDHDDAFLLMSYSVAPVGGARREGCQPRPGDGRQG